MNAWKQHTEPLDGEFPALSANPSAVQETALREALTGPEARAFLAAWLEAAPDLPDLCEAQASALEGVAEQDDLHEPDRLADLTARMNAGLRGLALALSALAELLEVARAGQEGGRL